MVRSDLLSLNLEVTFMQNLADMDTDNGQHSDTISSNIVSCNVRMFFVYTYSLDSRIT